ncbi:MAG TPA: type I secretion system permease/ATPase, partial [Devosia sp.]|nr:type I secretion system permease/ATPase [Devosia sp.]
VYDRVLVTGRVETLLLLTGLIAGALLLLGLLDSLRANLMVRVGCWLNNRLGPVLLSSGVRAKLLGDTSGAQLLRDLAQVQGFISSQGLTMFFDAPWTPIFLILIWMLHPLLGMVALASTILLLGLSVLNEYVTRQSTLNAAVAGINAQQYADTTIRNAEVVRAMGMLPAMTARWSHSNDAALDATRKAAERGGLILGLSKFLRFFVQSAILGLGAYLVLQGHVSGGIMIAASILLGRALAPVEAAMATWRNFVNARIAYRRLKARLQAIPPEADRVRLPEPYGQMSLDKVSFLPPGNRAPILDNVSMRIMPGEVLAVIGPSASGKSTLCRMIMGLYAPTGGDIRLDGSELQHWDSEQLGQYFGYLPQDVELFAGTVSENIARMGSVDDDKVVEAATLAHAHDLVQGLPQGYNTQIGDGGSRLSGGQRQRIGLARALYGRPRVVVLDEPNANLDQSGEVALTAAISQLRSRDTALIIVGHRPSTLACADRVIFLREGRIELQGDRDEVLRRLRSAAPGASKIATMSSTDGQSSAVAATDAPAAAQ